MDESHGDPVRLLFVKLGAIGDVVQAAVAMGEFRRRVPAARVDWVVGDRIRSLVEAFGVADRVVPVSDDGLYAASTMAKASALVRCAVGLAGVRGYDRIVTAYSDWRYGLLTAGVPAKRRERFKPSAPRPSPIQHRSRVHEYWRLLSGGDSDPIDIAAATRELGLAMKGAAPFSTDYRLPERFIAVAPGGARNQLRDDALRRWPIERYRSLVETLVAKGNAVVLLGAAGDRWAADALSGLKAIDLIGRTNLPELLAVLRQARVFVGNDSGVLHLAGLTGAGVVGLFGPTPANSVLPLGRARTFALASENRVSCSPCYDGRNFAACSRNVCMEAISVDVVLSAIEAAAMATEQ